MNWFWIIVIYLSMEIIINVVFHIVSRKLKSEPVFKEAARFPMTTSSSEMLFSC